LKRQCDLDRESGYVARDLPESAVSAGCRGLLFAAVGLFIVSSAACGKRNAYVEPPPPKVVVGTPVQRTVTLYHEFPGTTQGIQSVNIIPRVLGYLDSLHFKDGGSVTKGQLLFIIDPRPYQDAYDVTRAQVDVADAAYKEAQADYARAKAVAKTPGAIAPQDVDKFKATEEQAQANLELARANMASAKLNLDFTHITAPISGRISRRLVDVGNLVTANVTVLTTIDQYDPMYAYFNPSEAQFLDYLKRTRAEDLAPKSTTSATNSDTPSPPNESDIAARKKPVEMGLANEAGYPHKGIIDFVDNRVDPNTGTILVRGVFANPQPYLLAPGLFVRIRVPIGTQAGALLVPDRALSTDQQGQFLLIVKPDNVVEHRAVEVGTLHGELRVIDSGVKPGEQFIVEGLQFARPGIKVTPVTESPAPAADGEAQQPTAPQSTPPANPAAEKSAPEKAPPENAPKAPASSASKNESE
jgi:RND family efflux transporter MFP subunit